MSICVDNLLLLINVLFGVDEVFAVSAKSRTGWFVI